MDNEIKNIIRGLQNGDLKSMARSISYVENDLPGAAEILTGLKFAHSVPVLGITGPPGAGKSTLINELIQELVGKGKKVGVLCVDPSSPFNYGSILADRLRMGTFYDHDSVFIRSIATRGSLGGLSAKAVEITDIMRSFGFDHIIVETVGVGQSEVEIAGLADTTALVLVPESGDEVQAIKSGIMEIADIFVINKADRKGAELLEKNLNQLLNLYSHKDWLPPIIKTIATDGKGVTELIDQVKKHQDNTTNERKYLLLAEKAYSLIQNRLMKPVSKSEIKLKIQSNAKSVDFNLYDFVENWIKSI